MQVLRGCRFSKPLDLTNTEIKRVDSSSILGSKIYVQRLSQNTMGSISRLKQNRPNKWTLGLFSVNVTSSFLYSWGTMYLAGTFTKRLRTMRLLSLIGTDFRRRETFLPYQCPNTGHIDKYVGKIPTGQTFILLPLFLRIWETDGFFLGGYAL